MSDERLISGHIRHVQQSVLRGVQTLEIGTGAGTFPIKVMGHPGPRIGDEVQVTWIDGLPRLVTWGDGIELWRERYCDLCGHSDAEHDPAECTRLARLAVEERIALHGECPACDLGIDFAACTCPPPPAATT